MIEVTSKVFSPGDTYGRFAVLGVFRDDVRKSSLYIRVQCACGSTPRYVRSDTIRNGTSKSCGCLQKETSTKHGAWGKPLFKVWSAMVRRCTSPKDKRYQRYGGRGIKVCDRWLDVNNFISDMTAGYEQGMSLDRKNNDGNYEPDNCKWSTTKQQTRNYSRNVVLNHDGKSMCVVDWAEVVGISPKVIYERVAAGWSTKDALTKSPNCGIKRTC